MSGGKHFSSDGVGQGAGLKAGVVDAPDLHVRAGEQRRAAVRLLDELDGNAAEFLYT
jgi:hypothetical protein